jgi:putative DNA methylase
LVKWENSTNEEVLERARAEIRKSCGGELPPVYDPFSGGGSIPLEAQRLGLPAYGSDLNPVAVMIGKAMIEIPPKFKDQEPIHPGAKDRQFYRNAEGLAEDVKYYGEWMREKAWERIGHLYPAGRSVKGVSAVAKATVIAWIWARTVPSPDPAFARCAGADRIELPAQHQDPEQRLKSLPVEPATATVSTLGEKFSQIANCLYCLH